MALPNKKINKIKLPGDGQGSQTYEIIPERLENGGFEAALPTLTQDSVLALQGEAITQVESAADIPDNVSGLYRYPEDASFGEQSSHVIEVMRKDYDASEVVFEKTTEANNTQLTSTTFFNQFASTLPGWLSISAISGVYALYYNLPFNGIRFGAGSSAGSMTFTLSADCDITFYKYFSYNGSTQEIIGYDAAAKAIVDGTDYTFADDTTPVVVHLAAGQHTVSSYYYQDPDTQEKTTGRIILTKFEFEGEPYSAYEAKELARVEEVQAVDAKLEQHKTESHNRFVADEQAIAANRQGITDINGKMGDIQAFQSAYSRLPTPSVEYANKLYRDKYSNALFQCVDLGQGVAKDWSFSGVSGTSEITESNVDSFYSDAGDSFETYFSVTYEDSATTKFYRNNGSLKLGSSGNIGQVEFLAAEAAANENLSRLKIGVKAYNANGSTVGYEVELYDRDNDGYNYITGEVFVSDNTTETLIDLSNDIPSGCCLSYLDIRSVAQHNTGTQEEPVMVNNDKRLVITRLIMDLGEVSYTWVPEGFAQLVLTDSLLVKNIPVGGAYLYKPEDSSGYIVHKYDDGSATELRFQFAEGYSFYAGATEDIKNTPVQDILDDSDSYTYTTINILKKLSTTYVSGLTPQSEESLYGSSTINLHKISKTGSYNDLQDKPTIPTVNNGTLTIQGGGTAAATFTANQSGNSTLNIKGSGGTTVTRSADGEITISTDTIPMVNIENGSGSYSLKQKESETGPNPPANTSTGEASVAFGYRSTASNVAAMALGEGAEATGRNSFASNEMTEAIGRGSHAEGKVSSAVGMYTHAEGSETSAGFSDQTVGTVWGDQASHAEGYQTIAKDRYTHAEGYGTLAGHEGTPTIDLPNNPGTENFQFAEGAHAEGYQTKATIVGAHSEGVASAATGYASHAEGFQTISSAEETHAEGSGTTASYRQAHAEGRDTTASGATAHAEGESTTASGNYSHASGYHTTASGVASTAIGSSTTASNSKAFASGTDSIAKHVNSSSFGAGTVTGSAEQMAIGEYNIETSNALFVVGNGSDSNNRSNAFAIYKDGHAEIDAMSSDGKSVATKSYVDDRTGMSAFSNRLSSLPADLSFADPTVWDGEDGYFYATHTGSTSVVYRSVDLVNWENLSKRIFSPSAVNALNTLGYDQLWAPQVKNINGRFILYAAAVNEGTDPKKYAIVALTSTTPDGPFESPVVITTTADSGVGNAIDPYVAKGKDGNLYLFFGSSYGIYYTELNYDGLSLAKDATFTHVAGKTIAQSPLREDVYEGTCIYHRGNYYYMFVSAGHAGTSNYCLKVGRSTSLFGTYTDSQGKSLLSGGGDTILSGTDDDANGPGHCSEVFVDRYGRTYLFYHCHTTPSPSTHIGETLNWKRNLFLQEIYWNDAGWPYFGNDGKPQLSNNVVPYFPQSSNDGIGRCITYPNLYNHALHILDNSSTPKMDVFATLISASGIALTKTTFAKYLYDYGYSSANRVLCVAGSYGNVGTNLVVGLFSADGTNVKVCYIENGTVLRKNAAVNITAFGDTAVLIG